MKPLDDGTLLAYIEGFYQATDDHIRAMYGAYIVGYLEAILGLSVLKVEGHADRKEE